MKDAKQEIILGIDPGTRVTGYGIIRVLSHGYEVIDFGCIRPPVDGRDSERYLYIFNGIESLINKHSPTAIAVESQFFLKNFRSAMKLGIARGVAMLAAERQRIPIFEYAPKQAKLSVCHGNASKEQVQKMIQLLLKLPILPTPQDAADALSLALCHAHQKLKIQLKQTYARLS